MGCGYLGVYGEDIVFDILTFLQSLVTMDGYICKKSAPSVSCLSCSLDPLRVRNLWFDL